MVTFPTHVKWIWRNIFDIGETTYRLKKDGVTPEEAERRRHENSDVRYEIFYIFPITIIAHQIHDDMTIIMICYSSSV